LRCSGNRPCRCTPTTPKTTCAATVTRREISFGTRSDTGRDSRDASLSLLKTATKLGIPFWKFLAARFGIDGAQEIPPLNELVLKAA